MFSLSLIFKKKFICEFADINSQGGFIVIIAYMHPMYFEQVHPLHYIPIPPSLFALFQTVFGEFHCVVLICI
jgi:hypothetical protein